MLSFVATLLAFAAPPSNSNDANAATRASILQMSMIAFMALAFWLLVIRPQSKKAAEQAALIKLIKPNDKVVTSGGILGTVVAVRDDSVTLRTGGSTLEVTKSSISQVTEKAS